MAKVKKKRNWTVIIYPESAPENWLDLLVETGLQFSVSPLHNLDVDEATGETKKAHYHLILCYPGPTTYNCVKDLCDTFNAPIPKPIESVGGLYRYFTHKDHPHKYQYKEEDIQSFNGFDIREYEALSRYEIDQLKMKVQQLVRDWQVTEYSTLMDLLLDNEMFDEWSVASSNTMFFDRYISSRRFYERDMLLDPEAKE